MKKYLSIIVGIFVYINSPSQTLKTDTLNQVIIPVKSDFFYYLNRFYSNETEIYPFRDNPGPIYGLTMSGKAQLNHDTSLIRVVLKDMNDNEYLIFESNKLLNYNDTINIHSACDETSLIDSITPKSILIIIQNAELYISKIKTFKIDRNTLSRYSLYKNLMIRNIQVKKLQSVKEYIELNNMIWSASQTPVSILSYSQKKRLYGKYYNTYGFEYYKDGFFEFKMGDDGYIGDSYLTEDTTFFIRMFDWRKRHGADNPSSPYYESSNGWITPNKCQAGCWLDSVIRCDIGKSKDSASQQPCIDSGGVWRSVGTCWAFASVASVEAVANLYYNQHIDLDLSEQE